MKYLFIIFIAAYFISPVDLIPDILGPLGRIDDLGLIAYGIYWFRKKRSLKKKQQHQTAQSQRSTNTENQQAKPKKESPYTILGVTPADSQEDIEKAYKELARKYHPDKVAHLGEELQKMANQKMAEITNAYQQVRLRKS